MPSSGAQNPGVFEGVSKTAAILQRIAGAEVADVAGVRSIPPTRTFDVSSFAGWFAEPKLTLQH